MRILCLGDSNTYGYDPRSYLAGRYNAENRWVDLLKKHTGLETCNLGVNGREIPETFPVTLLSDQLTSGDILLIMLGTNDLLQGASAQEAARKMEAFLQQFLPYCIKILLVAPPPMQRGAWVPSDALVAESIALAEEYRRLAEKHGICFVDTRLWNIDLTFDGVHFTEAGHHQFAKYLAEIIQ